MLPNKYLVFKIPYSRKTFEGENFRKFQGFVTIWESFPHEIWGRGTIGSTSKQFTGKVSLFCCLSTHNNTDSNKLVIFSSIALYNGDTL